MTHSTGSRRIVKSDRRPDGLGSDSGPSSGFVDGGTDVLDDDLREPDHRCGVKTLDSTKAGDRFTCPTCEIEYVFTVGVFRQWLPVYEQTGQLPHAHAFKITYEDDDRGAIALSTEEY